jgi:uncharacterized protein (TIGR02611 family)
LIKDWLVLAHHGICGSNEIVRQWDLWPNVGLVSGYLFFVCEDKVCGWNEIHEFSPMKRIERLMRRAGLDQMSPVLRKMLVAVIGTTIVVIGLVLIFLPGPGLLVILVGLAILATEFVWIRRMMGRGREVVKKVERTVKRR